VSSAEHRVRSEVKVSEPRGRGPIRAGIDRINATVNRPLYQIPQGQAGGGAGGAWSRFWRGSADRFVPNTPGELGTTALGGLIPRVLPSLFEGARDAYRGSNFAYNRADRRGDLGPPSNLAGSGEDNRGAPTRATRGSRPAPAATGNQNSPMRAGESGQTDPPETVEIQPGVAGQSMSNSLPRPIVAQRSRVGVRGGQTIAEGVDAQNMYGGIRDSANAAIIAEADRRWRERASMIEK
jgi:hypothetical protein